MADASSPRIAGIASGSFVRDFIAKLVSEGYRSLPPRDPHVGRGLRRVVEMLDEEVSRILEQGNAIGTVRPWIETGNRLRLSPTGGVENWEHALRAAQPATTSTGSPDRELLTFGIDEERARSELDHLDPVYREFLNSVAAEFIARADRAQ